MPDNVARAMSDEFVIENVSQRSIQAIPPLKEAMVEKRPSFSKLKKIERQRREILLRAELPFWRILLFWSGTCLKEISTDLLVWVTLGIYVAIRIYANNVDFVPDSVALLERTNISVVGGFLSFFLVLFVNQTNSRFLEMYGFSKACSGRIQDIAGLARTLLPPELGHRLVKHFNAAQVAGYVGLNAIGHGSPYSKAHFFDIYNSKHRLLNGEEMKELSRHDWDHSGLCMKELCTWCEMDVAEARNAGYIDSYQEKEMHDRILQFRAAMDGMYDYTDQPPHFFYIHFLVLLSALYLPLFAIDTAFAAGWGEETDLGLDVLNGVIVFLQCIFVVGLRSLGTKMIDPYGDDLEDLSVILYVEATIEICDTIMSSKQPVKTKLSPAPYGFPGASTPPRKRDVRGSYDDGDAPPSIAEVKTTSMDQFDEYLGGRAKSVPAMQEDVKDEYERNDAPPAVTKTTSMDQFEEFLSDGGKLRTGDQLEG